uniref:Ewing's tumor-associated antigen 1 n=1 Tax=Monopterus albus TaxID=43700 RepID=A0A3Q3KAF7_MONAL|nr:ewing's tumor-associated antigen 1 [Monopterus albus]
MSEPRTHVAAAAGGSSEFTELWRNVSKLCQHLSQDKKTGQEMLETASPKCKDLLNPKHIGCTRYPGLNNGESPGDAEVSQDIFWDATSPTQDNTGSRANNTRVMEISDIVNRIAPKDAKPKGTDSPMLQWIGDGAVSNTPEIPKIRVKKKHSRQSSVEDLRKLARQFDENMQQHKETSEQLATTNSNLKKCVNIPNTKLTEIAFHSNVKDLKCPPSSDQVEAELHDLFDSSTQIVNRRLSSSSSASACSQELKYQPVTSTSAEPQQSQLKYADKSSSAAHPSEERGSDGFSVNNCVDFDDDWENDDLLNDSVLLAMTHSLDQQHDTNPKTSLQSKRNTTPFTSVCNSFPNTNSTHQPLNLHHKPSSSALQELCPKPKTTNRSTFKLEPNPHFLPKTAAKDVSKSSFTAIRPKSQMYDRKSSTIKTVSTPQPDKITNDQKGACVSADSGKDISDSIWDDGDDALLYQVCDSVERISNSQPQQVSPSDCQQKQDTAVDIQRKNTAPLPINTTWSMNASVSAKRQPPHAFVRSNSLPGASCDTVNYQGRNIPMRDGINNSRMSQSFPGSCGGLGAFSQCRDSSGTLQDGDINLDMKQNSQHKTFKRNVSDSAAVSCKVFVTSHITGKCSTAEIERKKQEALARRRQRMQDTPKP